MVVFNYSGAEINAKVVYYGPALSGKTTNLEYIHDKMPVQAKGKMVSMKTRTDRTLFFDFLPLELGDINGYQTRILLYTVPGQVYYNATRKLVLKGADAVVFVADSAPDKIQENIDSLRNLEDNLNEHGLTLDTIPWVIQYNKRDLPDALPVDVLQRKLNLMNVPWFEAVATTGQGLYETFEAIAGVLYGQLAERLKKAEPAPAREEDVPPAGPAAVKPVVPKPVAQDADETEFSVLDDVLREVDAPEPSETPEPPDEEELEESGARNFGFTSGGEKMDDDVGRVIDFDQAETLPPPPSDSEDREFVLDPFQSSKKEKPKEEAAAKPQKASAKPKPASASPKSTPTKTAAPQPSAPTATKTPPKPAPSPAPPAAAPKSPVVETKATPKPAPAAPVHDAEEVTVTVPVVITRSQMRKNVPVKLTLEISVADD